MPLGYRAGNGGGRQVHGGGGGEPWRRRRLQGLGQDSVRMGSVLAQAGGSGLRVGWLLGLAEGEGHGLGGWAGTVRRRCGPEWLRRNADIRLGQIPQRGGDLQGGARPTGPSHQTTVHQEQLLGAIVVVLVDGIEALEAAAGAQQELRAGLDLQARTIKDMPSTGALRRKVLTLAM